MSSDIPWGTWAVVGVLLFGAYRCHEDHAGTSSAVAARAIDEDAARERADAAAGAAVSGTTYQDQGAPYGCTDDCSGHDAGYKWAEENEITDPDDCGGDSPSFTEGCQAYGEAYQEAHRAALEDEGVEAE